MGGLVLPHEALPALWALDLHFGTLLSEVNLYLFLGQLFG